MALQQPVNYKEQGGARHVIGGSLDVISGGDLDIESGAALKLAGTTVSATAAELNTINGYTGTTAALNAVDNAPVSFTFAAASGAANIAEVTITAKDADGNTVAAPLVCTVWLSDAATGVGLTTTAASGTVQAKSASGADFAALTAKKALVVQTLASGVYILEITDTAKTTFYVCAQAPNGAVSISTILATGDYG